MAENQPRGWADILDKATTFILVNMLWMVLAALIITLPLATAGLFATLTPWVRGQTSEPFRDFFGAMRRYARQSIVIFLGDIGDRADCLDQSSDLSPDEHTQPPGAALAQCDDFCGCFSHHH